MPLNIANNKDGTVTLAGLNEFHLQVIFHVVNINTFPRGLQPCREQAAKELYEVLDAAGLGYAGDQVHKEVVKALQV